MLCVLVTFNNVPGVPTLWLVNGRNTLTTIPAAVGEPYTVARSGRLIALERATPTGKARILFDPVAALAVADELVDLVEAMS
ncbi:Uncharacterised protein [Mycobacteroides abscessus subsp. abscessus]|nr:Uncharacterised protein [Mycobacteroides abscessus subsp. abscessus]